jgi:hypothetical protein
MNNLGERAAHADLGFFLRCLVPPLPEKLPLLIEHGNTAIAVPVRHVHVTVARIDDDARRIEELGLAGDVFRLLVRDIAPVGHGRGDPAIGALLWACSEAGVGATAAHAHTKTSVTAAFFIRPRETDLGSVAG